MEKKSGMKSVKNIFLISAGLCIVIIGGLYSNAFAWRGGDRYYFHGGMFYHPSRFWYDVAVAAPPIGVIVESLPYGYTAFMAGGVPYYYYQGSYFTPCPNGYLVVPVPAPVAPVEQQQAAPVSKVQTPVPATAAPAQPRKSAAGDSVVINVPDKNGGYLPVVLVKHGDGYVGPQGEYYAGHPTIDQLRVLYGK